MRTNQGGINDEAKTTFLSHNINQDTHFNLHAPLRSITPINHHRSSHHNGPTWQRHLWKRKLKRIEEKMITRKPRNLALAPGSRLQAFGIEKFSEPPGILGRRSVTRVVTIYLDTLSFCLQPTSLPLTYPQ